MMNIKLRNIVAATSCMVLLGTGSSIAQAATVTAPNADRGETHCELTGTYGELQYYDLLRYNDDRFDQSADIELMKAALPVIKGLLENKTTGPYTELMLKDLSENLAKYAKDLQDPQYDGRSYYPYLVNYQSFPDDLFITETDPTLSYSPYVSQNAPSWRDRADSALQSLNNAASTLMAYRLVLAEGKQNEIAPSLYRLSKEEYDKWDQQSDSYHVVGFADGTTKVERDLAAACNQPSKRAY